MFTFASKKSSKGMMNEEKQIIAGSPMAWLLAARPKTLAGAAVPVMIGLSMAFADGGVAAFRLAPAILCVLFAFIMQIDANFINDYFDFIRGNDDETRLGPRRACAQGWISAKVCCAQLQLQPC